MKKLFILVGFALMLPFAVSADINQTCRNDSIVSYTPATQTTGDFSEVVYWVKESAKISSLEAYINGESRPVEYREENGMIRAKVRIPSEISGDVVVGIGAGQSGGCNKPIWFAFTKS